MHVAMWAYPDMNDSEQIPALKAEYCNNKKESLLRKSIIKLCSDGRIGSTTAALFNRYKVDLGILPENKGKKRNEENYYTTDYKMFECTFSFF